MELQAIDACDQDLEEEGKAGATSSAGNAR